MSLLIIRLIIFVALFWLGLKLFRAWSAYQKQVEQEKAQQHAPPPDEQMVKCNFCGLHLPQSQAHAHEALWFCCHEHQERFLRDGRQKEDSF